MKNVLLLTGFLVLPLAAAEYFTAPFGSDLGPGSEKSPFKTVGRGVKALKPGDTLTIFPGRYHEAVEWKFNGSSEQYTTVRAKIPGTVLLHGDRPVTGFRPVPGIRNWFVTDFPFEPEIVLEQDTRTAYMRGEPVREGSPLIAFAVSHYDRQNRKLYIATSDGADPALHRITAAAFKKHGFGVVPADPKGKVGKVVIDGLCCTGFFTNTPAAHQSIWGIFLDKPENCIVRRCSAYLNAGGIGMQFAEKSRIESSKAFCNGTSNHGSAGNIIMLNSRNSVIDGCFSLMSRTYGIRFYGGLNYNNRISRSASLGDSRGSASLGDSRGSIWIKPCDEKSILSQVFADSLVACKRSEYSIFSVNDYDRSGKNGKTSQPMNKLSVFSCGRDFADPWNGDLRLQKGSKIERGFPGEDVYFIAPDGRDSNDGRSIESPWKTLKNVPSDSTVYFLPGTYAGGLELKADRVTLAGRGQHAPALIPSLTLNGNNITLLRLKFTGTQTGALVCSGRDIMIDRCEFDGGIDRIAAKAAGNLKITHCAFDGAVRQPVSFTRSSGVVLHSILKDSKLPDGFGAFDNSYPGQDPLLSAVDGLPFGPYFIQYAWTPGIWTDLKLLQSGSTLANIGWWSTSRSKMYLLYRPKNGGQWKAVSDYTADNTFHTVTLTGLRPGTEYEFLLRVNPAAGYRITREFLPPPAKGRHSGKKHSGYAQSQVQSFVTPQEDRVPKEWYVAPDGNDTAEGSREKPFKTIFRAALAALPGDSVIIRGGCYRESVTIPGSGLPGRPVRYLAAAGEKVWLDGDFRKRCRGFVMFGKEHLQFDGFRFRSLGTAYPNSSGAFMIQNGGKIEVTRCFHDGRGGGYAPSILNCRGGADISLRNSAAISGMTCVTLVNARNIGLKNNVFVMPSIWAVAAFGVPAENLTVSGNIFTGNTRAKTFEPLLRTDEFGALKESNNVYYVRFPRELRKLIGYLNDGKTKRKSWTFLTLDEYYRKTGKDGGSFFADPKFPVMNLRQWKTAAERDRDQKQGVSFGKRINDQEWGRNPKDMTLFISRDFDDCFASTALMGKDGKIIGLDPAIFKDMKLDRTSKTWEKR